MYEKNIQDAQDRQDPRGTQADAPARLQILTDDALATLHGGDSGSNSGSHCCN
jgi:hypothetical protein